MPAATPHVRPPGRTRPRATGLRSARWSGGDAAHGHRPATDAPATLDRCLEGLGVGGAGETIVVAEPRAKPALGGAEPGRPGSGTDDVLVFVRRRRGRAPGRPRPDPGRVRGRSLARSPSSAPTTPRPAARGTVSRFRNLLHHHVHHQAAGRRRPSGPASARSGATPSWRSGGFDADPAVPGGHRARHAPGRRRRTHPPRSGDRADAPQALDAREHGPDRSRRPGRALGPAAAAPRLGVGRAQSRLRATG